MRRVGGGESITWTVSREICRLMRSSGGCPPATPTLEGAKVVQRSTPFEEEKENCEEVGLTL